jgi:hypothetical protein
MTRVHGADLQQDRLYDPQALQAQREIRAY